MVNNCPFKLKTRDKQSDYPNWNWWKFNEINSKPNENTIEDLATLALAQSGGYVGTQC